MKVRDIIEYAQYGELKQLSLKDDVSALLSFINLGLVELYKRFNLSIKTEIIQTVPEIKVYNLRNTDISNILIVYNSKGEKLSFKQVTDEDEEYDITQLSYNSFLFREPNNEEIMFLYKASPEFVNNEEDEIKIPKDMFNALLNYIAYKGQMTMNKQNNLQSPMVNFYNIFDKECQDLEQRGYNVDLFSTESAVQKWGFK